MADRELRLRLQVRRHGLPDVNLLWTAPATPDSTIAKLVEKVNEVIPLESGDWGLDDYVVELKSADGTAFECLHFQQVAKVLKEDDQVILRSLLTDDLRLRRASGRHQITADGRHLVDGVAYGRRWMSAPRHRPPVALPPRKRARVEPSAEYDEEYDEHDSPLLLDFPSHLRENGSRRPSLVRFAADFDDDDIAGDDEFEPDRVGAYDDPISSADEDNGSDEDADLIPETDLTDELQDLRNDSAAHGMRSGSSPRPEVPVPGPATRGSRTARKRKASFSSTSSDSESDSDSELESDAEGGTPLNTTKTNGKMDEATSDSSESSNGSSGPESSDDSIDFDGSDGDDTVIRRPRIYDAAALGLDESSIESGSEDSDASHAHNTVIRYGNVNGVQASDSEESSSDSSGDSSSDSSSSDDDSSEDSEESDEDDTTTRRKVPAPKSGKTSSSSSSNSSSSSDDDSTSESDSDSEPDEVSSKPAVPHSKALDNPPAPKPTSPTKDEIPVPPGQGMRKTQRRNLRRRLAKMTSEQKVSPSEQAETLDAATSDTATTADMAEFLLRKKALLDLMDVDTPGKSQPSEKPTASTIAVAPTPYAPGSFPVSLDETSRGKLQEIVEENTADANVPKTDDTSPSTTVQRRLKLNVDAGRRMLFGALGMRNPKSKEDEEKLRSNLMKNIRPLKNHRTDDTDNTAADKSAQTEVPVVEEEEDPDAWRRSISYRAVECCDEGVELSEPPFPFVQRWDPQQQGHFGKKKGGKRKRKQAGAQTEEGTAATASKKPKVADDTDAHDESWATWENPTFDDTVLSNDDPPSKLTANESQFSDNDDLPALPADLMSLPSLTLGAAKPGMVITYKHWRLGGQTSWGPELADLTAVVVKIEADDGSRFRVILAKRDRDPDTSEKMYDEVTGQRIYGRFEAPDMDEDLEDDENPKGPDEGYRDVDFSELIEPRIVQQPPTSYSQYFLTKKSLTPEINSSVDLGALEKDVAGPDGVVPETQYDEMDFEAPTSAQMVITEQQQSSSTEAVEDGDKAQDNATEHLGAARSKSSEEKDPSPPEGRKINSPSRQLEEMSANMIASEQPPPPQQPSSAPGEDPVPSVEVIPDSVPEDSTDGGIHSGRQPDPDFLGDSLEKSPARLVDLGDESISQDMTPKAEPLVATPQNALASLLASSPASLPTLDEVWNTATTSRNLRSLTKGGPESSHKKPTTELPRGTDGVFSTPKKNLFPNATQPAKAVSPVVKKPVIRNSTPRKRRTSAFTIPEGSQVVSLSSDDEPAPEEHYADDDVDADYKSAASTPKGKSRVQKNTQQSASKGKGKGKAKETGARSVSMPASARRVLRRGSTSTPSLAGKGKGRGGRRSSADWDGEI